MNRTMNIIYLYKLDSKELLFVVVSRSATALDLLPLAKAQKLGSKLNMVTATESGKEESTCPRR